MRGPGAWKSFSNSLITFVSFVAFVVFLAVFFTGIEMNLCKCIYMGGDAQPDQWMCCAQCRCQAPPECLRMSCSVNTVHLQLLKSFCKCLRVSGYRYVLLVLFYHFIKKVLSISQIWSSFNFLFLFSTCTQH